MDIEELLNFLELDSPEEFEYFEHLADLLELEREVSPEACYALFSGVSERTLTELIASYFEEIMENLPDDTVDIYTLLTTIRQNLLGLARSVENPDGLRLFADEFQKFRSWYSLDSHVRCKRMSDGSLSDVTVCEALALCRLEKLNEDEYDYDFSDCLDYELDEYRVNLSELMGGSFGTAEADAEAMHGHEDCDCGHDHEDHRHRGHGHSVHCDYDGLDEEDPADDEDGGGFDAFTDGLVDRSNPVIDGEFEDE